MITCTPAMKLTGLEELPVDVRRGKVGANINSQQLVELSIKRHLLLVQLHQCAHRLQLHPPNSLHLGPCEASRVLHAAPFTTGPRLEGACKTNPECTP